MKKTEFQIILDLNSMHRKLIVNEVIQELISLKDKNMLLSGEDSGLKNVWEEICVQVQDEYSYHWDVYENTIENCIRQSISKQPKEVIDLFRYVGNIGFEEEQEYFEQDIEEELKEFILSKAEYYENSNITNFLEQNYGEKDDEDYEDDDDVDDDYNEDYEDEDDAQIKNFPENMDYNEVISCHRCLHEEKFEKFLFHSDEDPPGVYLVICPSCKVLVSTYDNKSEMEDESDDGEK